MREREDATRMEGLPKMLEWQDVEVRAKAAFVMGVIGDKAAMRLMETRGKETDPRVKFEIAAALARLEQGCEPGWRTTAGLWVWLQPARQLGVCGGGEHEVSVRSSDSHWGSRRDLNPLPFRCERNALPAELRPQRKW